MVRVRKTYSFVLPENIRQELDKSPYKISELSADIKGIIFNIVKVADPDHKIEVQDRPTHFPRLSFDFYATSDGHKALSKFLVNNNGVGLFGKDNNVKDWDTGPWRVATLAGSNEEPILHLGGEFKNRNEFFKGVTETIQSAFPHINPPRERMDEIWDRPDFSPPEDYRINEDVDTSLFKLKQRQLLQRSGYIGSYWYHFLGNKGFDDNTGVRTDMNKVSFRFGPVRIVAEFHVSDKQGTPHPKSKPKPATLSIFLDKDSHIKDKVGKFNFLAHILKQNKPGHSRPLHYLF